MVSLQKKVLHLGKAFRPKSYSNKLTDTTHGVKFGYRFNQVLRYHKHDHRPFIVLYNLLYLTK